MTAHWVYFTNTATDTVHLAPFEPPPFSEHTLCGRPVGDMQEGDETLSGIVATCARCTRIANIPFPSTKENS